MDSQFLPAKQYKRFVEKMPILCVDLIVECDGYFVLVKRTRNPLKGSWWIPGGRVMKGEKAFQAAKRIAFEELGIRVNVFGSLGFYEDFFHKSHFGCSTHTLSIVYKIEISEKTRSQIMLDGQSSGCKIGKELPARFKNKLKCW